MPKGKLKDTSLEPPDPDQSASRLNRFKRPREILVNGRYVIMPRRDEIVYFGAGPAGLPTSVLEQSAASLVNFKDTGLGIAEHSHRSNYADDILTTTKADLTKYLEIPDNYEILFMQGGGSGEFSATVYNLVGIWVARRKEKLVQQGVAAEEVAKELKKAVEAELKIDYLVTGSWSLKASQEAARLLGPEYVNIASDARRVNDGKFGKIAAEDTWKLSENAAMVYYCDNETVDGVEFPGFPKILESKNGEDGPIVVADMSSNILSRKIPIKNFSLIFFGAQKNLGTAGLTVVIIKKSLLPPTTATPEPSLMRALGLPIGPIVLDYATTAKNNSLYNTLSIFDVYVASLVLKKLLETYKNGVNGQEADADTKAKAIYGVLDANPSKFRVVPDKSARSRMNICFRILVNGSDSEEAEKRFIELAKNTNGLLGLKGHRSVGGIRASNYNSVSIEGAEKLADFLKYWASTN